MNLPLTPRDQSWLNRLKISTEPEDLSAKLSRVPPDGYTVRAAEMAKSHGAELDAAYRGWAEASYKLGVAQEREEIIQERLESVAAERDAAKRAARKATWWKLASWALALLYVWTVILWVAHG